MTDENVKPISYKSQNTKYFLFKNLLTSRVARQPLEQK